MKHLSGVVTALSGQQTAIVSVSKQWRHPLYLKSVKRTKRYACHYDKHELVLGDTVLIQSCRPLSKTKRFKIVNKVE